MKDHRLLGVPSSPCSPSPRRRGGDEYSLEQMAFFAPIAVCVLGATVAVVMLW
jgi:hypothetical protein